MIRNATARTHPSSPSSTKPRQEPHRVYIQKRNSNDNISNNSTALRFTDTTLAKDVTNLIRSKLGLKRNNNEMKVTSRYYNGDKLILIGIITGIQHNAIYFDVDHLMDRQQRQVVEDDTRGNPINIVRTLLPTENPLQVRDEMMKHLRQRQLTLKNCGTLTTTTRSYHPNSSTNKHPKQQNAHTMTMWFFQPGEDIASDHKDTETYLEYVELNGYCSGMDDSSVGSAECMDDDSIISPKAQHDTNTIQFWNEGDYGYSFLLSSSSKKKYPLSKERYYHDRCVQSIENHTKNTGNTSKHFYKEGYLYKRSRIDPNIWKKVYCILTQEELWYISRVITCKNNKTKKQKYRYISLSNALLIPNNNSSSDTIPNKIEICTARGDVYYFRTADENSCKFWVEAIENYIQICSENSYVHSAELIMSEQEWVNCNRS